MGESAVMTQDNLTIIGLLLNLIGTVVLVFFARPKPSFEPVRVRHVLIYKEDDTEDERNVAIQRKRRLYERTSVSALVTVATGFCLQIVAVLL